jgi:GNAT superfamily N-acetyltransferase
MNFKLRQMRLEDIPRAIRLNEAVGWNQTAADWVRFISASPEGCFVMESQDQVIGTSATIVYEGRFAWVGMLVVDEQHRGRGIGTALLNRAIRFLDLLKIPTIKLDATPQGKPLYEKLGFVSEYGFERWMLSRTATGKTDCDGPVSIEPVLPLDRKIFGADRSSLLRSLAQEAPHLAFIEQQKGKIQGYSFGRIGSRADHMGPWVAHSRNIAEKLLNLFLLRSSRELVFVDCLELNPWAVQLVQASGFEFSRPLTRMYRGINRYAGRIKHLYASLGPEFG